MAVVEPETVRVGVLGPLAVSRGGVPVDVGGPHLQAVLVTLVHHLDEVVPVDTLIDALWGGDPPKSARNAIQVHISQLRRVLGPSFDLRTVRHGYSLSSAGIELDSADFERLGESAVQRGDDEPTTVVGLARAALSLWRGIPAADDSALHGALSRESDCLPAWPWKSEPCRIRATDSNRVGRGPRRRTLLHASLTATQQLTSATSASQIRCRPPTPRP